MAWVGATSFPVPSACQGRRGPWCADGTGNEVGVGAGWACFDELIVCLLQTFIIFSKRFSQTDSHVHNSYNNIRSTKRALRQSYRLGRQSFAVKLEHFEGHHGKLLHCRRLFQALVTHPPTHKLEDWGRESWKLTNHQPQLKNDFDFGAKLRFINHFHVYRWNQHVFL